jgi:hypothetical protein
LVVASLLFFGCVDLSPPLESTPSDFKLVYEPFSAMSMDRWSVLINSDDSGVVTHFAGLLKKEYLFNLTKEEVLSIANSVKSNSFFSMNESYVNLNVMDGGGARLTVTMNGVTKKVSVTNYDHPSFTNIKNLIYPSVFEKAGIQNMYDLDANDLLSGCDLALAGCLDENKDYLCNVTRSLCDGK